MVSMVSNPNFVNDAGGVGIAGLRDGSVAAYFSGSWDYKNVKEILVIILVPYSFRKSRLAVRISS